MTLQIVSWLRRALSRSDTSTSSSDTHPLVAQIRQLRRRWLLALVALTLLFLLPALAMMGLLLSR
jgi:hypothetical protein